MEGAIGVLTGRSGLVHGTTSVQKGESGVQVNGSSIRGSSKIELDGSSYALEKSERFDMTERERERVNGKLGAKYVCCSGVRVVDICIAISDRPFRYFIRLDVLGVESEGAI